MSRDLTSTLRDYVSAGVDAHALGDDVGWAVTVQMMPTPQGIITATVITLDIPSLVLGEHVVGSAMMPTVTPTAEQVAKAVGDLLGQLREQRSAQAAQANGHHPGGPSSLIRP